MSVAAELASWWSRPTADEVARWDEPPGPVDEALEEEYERLLVGPGRAPCPPYESLWRSDAPRREQGRLMAACAVDVAALYGELGLKVREDARELPDQLAVELEALAYALETGADGVAQSLVRDHLAVWVPAFCERVARETTHPFYAALATRTPELLASLSP